MIAEHRKSAKGFRLGRLVLKNVPVLGELAILKTHDVGGDHRSGTTVARKASVRDNVISFGEDQVIFVVE